MYLGWGGKDAMSWDGRIERPLAMRVLGSIGGKRMLSLRTKAWRPPWVSGFWVRIALIIQSLNNPKDFEGIWLLHSRRWVIFCKKLY